MLRRVPDLALVHLVWAPLGPEPLRRFLASCRRHPPGAAHRLVILCNGFGGGLPPAFAAALDGVEHELVHVPEPVQDLAAYRAAVQQVESGWLCFVNSYGEALADDWLGTLAAAAARDGVGMVGASGSWESAASSAPLALRVQRHLAFPRFPNPHLRTTGFLLGRELALALDWGGTETKLGALRLESGRRSLSRQVRAQGLEVPVVDRWGAAWPSGRWPESRTFRSGAQEGLLIADNRTAQYAASDPAERLRLARMAWGDRAVA